MSPLLDTVGRQELAQLLRIAPSSLDRCRRAGTFPVPAIDWPGHPKWSRALVAEWLGGDPAMADELFALLTLTEVAELLGLKRSTAYRQLRTGRLRHAAVRLTCELRYPLVAVIAMLGTSVSTTRSGADAIA